MESAFWNRGEGLDPEHWGFSFGILKHPPSIWEVVGKHPDIVAILPETFLGALMSMMGLLDRLFLHVILRLAQVALSFLFFLSLFILRERAQAGEEQRERESQAGSALSAQSPMWGLTSQTRRS